MPDLPTPGPDNPKWQLPEPSNKSAKRKSSLIPKFMLSGWVLALVVLCTIVGSTMVVMHNTVEDVPGGRPRNVDEILAEKERGMKQTVVYAKRDIAEDAVISSDDLEEKQVLKSKIPDNAVTSLIQVLGSYAAMPIAQGTPILSEHISTSSTRLKPQAQTKETRAKQLPTKQQTQKTLPQTQLPQTTQVDTKHH